VVLKVHPEVMAGRKRGHFDIKAVGRLPRVRVLGQDVHPASLIEQAEAVYVVTSQMGFEGLLWGKRVRTFGMPFYAGWGLTQDALPSSQRRKSVALEDLAFAALVDYPRYLDPETGQRCEAERLIEWLALQRRMRERFPARVYALNFSWWKRPIVRAFFQGSEVRFLRDAHAVPRQGTRVVWGSRQISSVPDPGRSGADDAGRVIRLEDGFLRSVGLGADLVRPLSWVMDGRGIYYDATRPSDLEHLLQTHQFDATLVQRAAALRQSIVEQGLTKYNVNGPPWKRPPHATRVILVPGQVETDASIAFGAPDIRKNIDLLRAVRLAAPDAYVVYKPHPDVVAGLRRRGVGEEESARWCDETVTECAMADLLEAVDEVHGLTSLAGFEALLRGKIVVVYGQPFYAGWGLTQDRVPLARRTRKLALDELVAGVLILYPAYVSRTTGRYTTPERALVELLAWRHASSPSLPLWRRLLRLVLGLTK
jgi:capsular polysaccharide export protein